MSYLSEDEILAAKRTAMPPPLGDIHFALWKDTVLLHWKWNEYRVLFGTSPKEIELLNAVAPSFFYQVERAIWQDIILHLSRLTDNARAGRRQRLSLTQLPLLIPDLQFRDEIQSYVSKARQKVNSFARGWRDRRFAHEDFPVLEGERSRPLPPMSRKHVEDALSAIRDVLNRVETYYENHDSVPYDHVGEPVGGAASLLFYLEKGLQSERKEREKWTRKK